ncbi:MAG: ABC transporter permease subunit [Planctomycetes bacterium]|nr:ABC transporter permease subunit [Planctomycetota bacterium]
MHEVLVVFRRELKSYFLSPIAYVFGVLMLSMLLYYAADVTLVDGSQASAENLFRLLPSILLYFLPGLTMRLWAEERKLGTLELLMTFPVTIGQLVLGKFSASLVYLGCVLLLTLGLPLTLAAYGPLDWTPVLASYLASVLFTGSFLAVGMFWSSLTRDQIVAMLLSLVSLFVLYNIGDPAKVEAAADWLPWWLVDVISAISPYRYFQSVARGVLDTRDFVYFACFCGLFLYANALVLHGRRQKG